MKKYGSFFIILICALLLSACAPEPERVEVFTEVEVTRIVEVPVVEFQVSEVIVIETVEVPIEVIVTPAVTFPTPAPTEMWPLTQFGDGVWLIGTEIERGIYKNIGPVGVDEAGNPMCDWLINKCFGGWRCRRDYGYGEYHYMVQLLYGDVTFTTARCGDWIKID